MSTTFKYGSYPMPFECDTENEKVTIENNVLKYITQFKMIEDQANHMADSVYKTLIETGFIFLANELVVFDPFRTFTRDQKYAFMESRIDAVMYDNKNNEIVVMDIKTRIGSTTQYKIGDVKHIRQLVIYAWLLFVNYHIQADSIMICYVNRASHVITVKIPLYDKKEKKRSVSRSRSIMLNPVISNLLDAYYELPGQYMDDNCITDEWPIKFKHDGNATSVSNPILPFLQITTYLDAFKQRNKVIVFKTLQDWRISLRSSKENAKAFFKDKVVNGLEDTPSQWRTEDYKKRMSLYSQGNHLYSWEKLNINYNDRVRLIGASAAPTVNFGNSSLLNYSRNHRENLEEENLREIGHQQLRNDINRKITEMCDTLDVSSLVSPLSLWKKLIKYLCYDINKPIQAFRSNLPRKFHAPLIMNYKDIDNEDDSIEDRLIKSHRIILYRFAHRCINSCLIQELIKMKGKLTTKEQKEYLLSNGPSNIGDSFQAPYPTDLIAWKYGDRDFCSGSRRQGWSSAQLQRILEVYLPHVTDILKNVLTKINCI